MEVGIDVGVGRWGVFVAVGNTAVGVGGIDVLVEGLVGGVGVGVSGDDGGCGG